MQNEAWNIRILFCCVGKACIQFVLIFSEIHFGVGGTGSVGGAAVAAGGAAVAAGGAVVGGTGAVSCGSGVLCLAGAPAITAGAAGMVGGATVSGEGLSLMKDSVSNLKKSIGGIGGSGSNGVEKISPHELLPTETPGLNRIQQVQRLINKYSFDPKRAIKYLEYKGEKYIVNGHHRAEAAKNLGINVYARRVGESYLNRTWKITKSDFVQKIKKFYKK